MTATTWLTVIVGLAVLVVLGISVGMSMETESQLRRRQEAANERRRVRDELLRLAVERRRLAIERAKLRNERLMRDKPRCSGCPLNDPPPS